VALNPPGQYADDRNLNARQRLWRCQVPFFEFTAWVLDLAGLTPGMAAGHQVEQVPGQHQVEPGERRRPARRSAGDVAAFAWRGAR
jgi:hypothetical protein